MNVYLRAGLGVLVVAAALVAWYFMNASKLPANQTPEGYKLISTMETEGMPDFSLQRLDGSQLRVSDLKGKVVIVNFWASWCNPCVEEFASMVKLVERFNGDVVVVAISEDEQVEDIGPFVRAFGLPKPGFEVVWDKEKAVMKLYGVGKLPESFIVGSDFKLIRKIVGTEDWVSDSALAYFGSILPKK
jgi:thiol-disulfide isomerase/thioredoxin